MGASTQVRSREASNSAGIVISRVLLMVALLVDSYLAWISLSAGKVAGCGPESNCHVVLNSKWAYWLGVPVSVLGVLVCAGLLVLSFGLGPSGSVARQRRAWQVVVPLSLLLIGAGAWFVFLQVVVLKTICPFCMTAHLCGIGAAALLLRATPIRPAQRKPKQDAQQVYMPPALVVRLGAAASAGLVLLVAGQIWFRSKTFSLTPVAAGVVTNAVQPTVREFQLFDGQFRFNLNEVPLIGRPSAPHIIVSLFDYTCHHCRDMHGPIKRAYQQFSNQLAVISLPMPLDGQCNHLVKRTQAPHTNACALARIGLTVWRAAPAKWPSFDDWLFGPATPPLPPAAEAHARTVVGPEAFDRAVTNRWVDDQIRQDIALYEANYRRFRKGFMPQLIIGTNLIAGSFSAEQLFQTLTDQFGLRRPADSPQ